MHEHVRRVDQAVKRRSSGRRLEVEDDTALVAVQMQEGAGHAVMAVGPVVAEGIALRAFHLDHVRAHIGEDMRRERPHDDVGQIDDTNTSQRSSSHSGPSPQLFL